MRMNSRQLEKYRAALEGLLSDVLLSTQNGKGRAGVTAAGAWPPPTAVLIFQERIRPSRVWERQFVLLLCT